MIAIFACEKKMSSTTLMSLDELDSIGSQRMSLADFITAQTQVQILAAGKESLLAMRCERWKIF
jgi:hypothetical protein